MFLLGCSIREKSFPGLTCSFLLLWLCWNVIAQYLKYRVAQNLEYICSIYRTYILNTRNISGQYFNIDSLFLVPCSLSFHDCVPHCQALKVNLICIKKSLNVNNIVDVLSNNFVFLSASLYLKIIFVKNSISIVVVHVPGIDSVIPFSHKWAYETN